MELTYDWKITALKKAPSLDGLSNVITHIRFDYTGTDSVSGESHTFHGACPVAAPKEGGNFTPITSLTEHDIIGWAKANHPTDHMNEVIEKNISDKLQPKNEDVVELDWLSVTDTTEAAPIEETE